MRGANQFAKIATTLFAYLELRQVQIDVCFQHREIHAITDLGADKALFYFLKVSEKFSK